MAAEGGQKGGKKPVFFSRNVSVCFRDKVGPAEPTVERKNETTEQRAEDKPLLSLTLLWLISHVCTVSVENSQTRYDAASTRLCVFVSV